jgi:hypothetical protein
MREWIWILVFIIATRLMCHAMWKGLEQRKQREMDRASEDLVQIWIKHAWMIVLVELFCASLPIGLVLKLTIEAVVEHVFLAIIYAGILVKLCRELNDLSKHAMHRIDRFRISIQHTNWAA